MDNLNDDALRHLNERDKQYGLNTVDDVKPEEPTVVEPQFINREVYSTSVADQPTWKLLDISTLPSGGLMYPIDSEIAIRSAKAKEIRHWSTIDEEDPIDVSDKINFILNACTKFTSDSSRIKLNYKDFCKVDRYHILFRIYELTFPNQENKLFANIKCLNPKCGTINKTQILTPTLKGFDYPDELMKWYSPEERCFKIVSEKLDEVFELYLPTIGTDDKFKNKRRQEEQSSIDIDKAFYSFGPYLINDWRGLDSQTISSIKLGSFDWPDNKFMFIHKFTKQLEDSSINKGVSHCSKCKEVTESHIFLGGSFTVKDIFIVSTRLDELI